MSDNFGRSIALGGTVGVNGGYGEWHSIAGWTFVNETELRDVLGRIQKIVHEETGGRLGAGAQAALARILKDVDSHNPLGTQGFASRSVTILLADIRGFTSISATYASGTVLEVLNRCLVTMSEIVFQHGGGIDKFMGDSVMAVFDGSGSAEAAARRALACAVDMQIAMDALNDHYKGLGLPELYLGIGINTGQVMAGVLGSDLYATYTVIGDEVNLASRIESFSLRGQVLIGESTYALCGAFAETGEPIDVHVKGKSEPVALREVLSIPSSGKAVPRREFRRSPRVVVRVPFSYQVIENKITLPQTHAGTILDIGYYGVLIETDLELRLASEIKLEFDLPLAQCCASDIYAKVVKSKPAERGYASGLEFTALAVEDSRNIQLFVQLLIQGGETR